MFPSPETRLTLERASAWAVFSPRGFLCSGEVFRLPGGGGRLVALELGGMSTNSGQVYGVRGDTAFAW